MQLSIKDNNNAQISLKYCDITKDFNTEHHFFCVYDKQETIKDLFNLQIRQNFAHVVVLFKNEDLNTILSHVNVYDNFSYTLIPEEIDKETYQRIYDFYFFSPMSVSYFTFAGCVVLKPRISTNVVLVDNNSFFLGECDEGCFLKLRNCSKIVPFLQLFHPYKLPTQENINDFCEIMKYYSLKVYEDFNGIVSDNEFFNVFSLARQSLGIKRHYWINVWGIY